MGHGNTLTNKLIKTGDKNDGVRLYLMTTEKNSGYRTVNERTPPYLSNLHKPKYSNPCSKPSEKMCSVPKVRGNQLTSGPSIMPSLSEITITLTSNSQTLSRLFKPILNISPLINCKPGRSCHLSPYLFLGCTLPLFLLINAWLFLFLLVSSFCLRRLSLFQVSMMKTTHLRFDYLM